MVTLVGTQSDFAAAIKDLIELDYDAIEAYEAAINRLDNKDYKAKLSEFKKDHQRHTQELSELLGEHHVTNIPSGPSNVKQWLTKGKVVLANLMGDSAILSAMISNETDTNTAYERIYAREDIWEEAKSTIRRGLDDERRHKAWLESVK